jgi:hypothetical protein
MRQPSPLATRPTLRSLLLATALLAPLAATAAASFAVLDLTTGSRFLHVAQTGSSIGSGSGLIGTDASASDEFGAALGGLRSGVLGVGSNGGFSFAATDTIRPAGVDGANSAALGLSTRGGVARSLAFLAGVNSAGGLSYFDPTAGLGFSTSSSAGLYSLGSDLLALSLRASAPLFGQDNTLGGGPANGLLGTTSDGRLRFVRTDGPAGVGGANMLSRPLGFAADGGLAEAAGFIVGVNTAGSLNVYDPLLDLLFEDIGPAGLFSLDGGLEAITSSQVSASGAFDSFGDIDTRFGRGVLGVTADGSLAYVRLDVIPSVGSSAAHALLHTSLGLDADSGLVVRNGLVTAMMVDATVPEPDAAALLAVAALALGVQRRRRALRA